MRVETRLDAELDVLVLVPGCPDCLRRMAWVKESMAVVSMVRRSCTTSAHDEPIGQGSTRSVKTVMTLGEMFKGGRGKEKRWDEDESDEVGVCVIEARIKNQDIVAICGMSWFIMIGACRTLPRVNCAWSKISCCLRLVARSLRSNTFTLIMYGVRYLQFPCHWPRMTLRSKGWLSSA